MLDKPLSEDAVENYIRNLTWSDGTPDWHKTLVAGNIRGFVKDFNLVARLDEPACACGDPDCKPGEPAPSALPADVRFWASCFAMAGLLATTDGECDWEPEPAGKMAVLFADALLAALSGREE